MDRTKGAQRRDAYVSFGLAAGFVIAIVVTHASGWVTTVLLVVASYDAGRNLRKLVRLGFTSRANNES